MRKGRLLAACAALAVLLAMNVPSATYAGTIADYERKLQQLQQEKSATKQKLQELSSQEQSLQSQISQLEQNIGALQASIDRTQADIARRDAQIAALRKKIAETEKQLNAQYGVLRQRVRVMYEAGQTSYLNVLFSSTSFSDLLDRLELLAMIAEQDKKVLNDIEQAKQALDQASQQLRQQQAAQEQAYHELLAKQSQAEQKKQQEQALLVKVHKDKLDAERDLASESSAMDSLQALVQRLEASEGTYSGPATGWVWPVPGYYSITSGYGWRTWPDGHREFHNGIDIPAPYGTPVVAATSGKVLYAGPASGFGDWIVIQSANGYLEIYGHMYANEIYVSPGQVVHAGQRIAGVGSNGLSTGPHLHFTIATGFDSSGHPASVNPLNYVHP